jgi:hypothetical protein
MMVSNVMKRKFKQWWSSIDDICKFALPTFILDFPEIHSISPSIADNSEDFPDPTRPTMATNDPSGMFISMLKYNQT